MDENSLAKLNYSWLLYSCAFSALYNLCINQYGLKPFSTEILHDLWFVPSPAIRNIITRADDNL
jgi:hypothetical protein